MKSSPLLYILLCTTSVLFPMKRPVVNVGPLSEQKYKKSKNNYRKNLKMSNFFATHAQLQHVCTKELHINPHIIDRLPQDIKNCITAKKLFDEDNQEWWYQTATVAYPDNCAYSLSFSPHNTVAVGLKNGYISFINLKDHTEISKIKISKTDITALSYNYDGSLFTYGTIGGDIKIVTSKTLTTDIPDEIFTQNNATEIWSVSVGNNNNYLAVSDGNNIITVIDLKEKKDTASSSISTPSYSVSLHPTTTECVHTEWNTVHYSDLLSPQLITAQQYDSSCDSHIYALACHYSNHPTTDRVVISHIGWVYINNPHSHKKFLTFSLNNKSPYAVALDTYAQQLAIGLDNGNVLLFKQHSNPTSQQIMLRTIIRLWLQTKRQNMAIIKSPQYLLAVIAHDFCLKKQELETVWQTFCPAMQEALSASTHKLIAKYGIPEQNLHTFNNSNEIMYYYKLPHDQYEKSGQFLLRKIIHIYAHQKALPDEVISLQSLPEIIAVVFNLKVTELVATWSSFSLEKQKDLVRVCCKNNPYMVNS